MVDYPIDTVYWGGNLILEYESIPRLPCLPKSKGYKGVQVAMVGDS